VGALKHTDGNGDGWVIFGAYPRYRIYEASDQYRIGYIAGEFDEICDLNVKWFGLPTPVDNSGGSDDDDDDNSVAQQQQHQPPLDVNDPSTLTQENLKSITNMRVSASRGSGQTAPAIMATSLQVFGAVDGRGVRRVEAVLWI
jgi:hypothetical protein